MFSFLNLVCTAVVSLHRHCWSNEVGMRIEVGVRYASIATALLVAVLQLAAACFSPADAYAIEVVLNKPSVAYDLSKLRGASEIEYSGGIAYAYRSRFDDRLVVVLSEQTLTGEGKHLAVRVQAPLVQKTYVTYACSIPLPCRQGLEENVRLTLAPDSGAVEVALGTLTLDSACYVRFRPELSASVRENASLIVSGTLFLRRGTDLEYSISMPCLLSVGEACFRILVLIPGYDAPMQIEPGVYEVSLTLSWVASAQAELVLKRLNVECGCVPWIPLARDLEWRSEGGELVKSIGSATVRVRSGAGSCEVAVEGAESLSEVAPELERLFEDLGLGRELVRKCNATKSVELKWVPLEQVSESDVKAALKIELTWLIESGVVTGLEPADVASILWAAELGYAGWNQRLVWHAGDWTPYSNVPGAALVRCAGGIQPAFLADSSEYASLSPAPAVAEGRREVLTQAKGSATWLQPLAVSTIVALVAAAISYAVIKKKLLA